MIDDNLRKFKHIVRWKLLFRFQGTYQKNSKQGRNLTISAHPVTISFNLLVFFSIKLGCFDFWEEIGKYGADSGHLATKISIFPTFPIPVWKISGFTIGIGLEPPSPKYWHIIPVPCPAGSYRSGSMTLCEPCQDGTVSPGTGTTSCTSCNSGAEANFQKTKCGMCLDNNFISIFLIHIWYT